MYINQVLGTHPTCTARSTAGIDMVACPTEDRAPLIAVIEDHNTFTIDTIPSVRYSIYAFTDESIFYALIMRR